MRNSPVEEAEDDLETERVLGLVVKAVEGDLREVAKAVVSQRDSVWLGPGEFDLRDRVLKAACHVLEVVVNDRKKGVTEAAARIVLTVGPTRFVEWRPKKVVSLTGPITVSFAYDHYSACGHGSHSWRDCLRLERGALTQPAEELSSRPAHLPSRHPAGNPPGPS